MCWFIKFKLTTILKCKHLQLSAIISFYNQCNAKCYSLYVVSFLWDLMSTIYWCVTKNESGLINSRLCCFICVELFTLGTLAFGCYLNWHSFEYYFYVHKTGKQQSYLIFDIRCWSGAMQFPPESPVHWLTRYLCNDRNTVLECFWVGSMDRIHRATNSVKPEWLDSSLGSALGVIKGLNASSHYRENLGHCFSYSQCKYL